MVASTAKGLAAMTATINDVPLTLSVPEAGKRYLGLSRNGAYDAAARGEIPTIRIGRLLRVPVRAMEAMLDRAGEKAA
jgi:excisionase family DNA binding protein